MAIMTKRLLAESLKKLLSQKPLDKLQLRNWWKTAASTGRPFIIIFRTSMT